VDSPPLRSTDFCRDSSNQNAVIGSPSARHQIRDGHTAPASPICAQRLLDRKPSAIRQPLGTTRQLDPIPVGARVLHGVDTEPPRDRADNHPEGDGWCSFLAFRYGEGTKSTRVLVQPPMTRRVTRPLERSEPLCRTKSIRSCLYRLGFRVEGSIPAAGHAEAGELSHRPDARYTGIPISRLESQHFADGAVT